MILTLAGLRQNQPGLQSNSRPMLVVHSESCLRNPLGVGKGKRKGSEKIGEGRKKREGGGGRGVKRLGRKKGREGKRGKRRGKGMYWLVLCHLT